jgi:hypothetical protein
MQHNELKSLATRLSTIICLTKKHLVSEEIKTITRQWYEKFGAEFITLDTFEAGNKILDLAVRTLSYVHSEPSES